MSIRGQRRRRGFLPSLIRFLFGWLRKAIPEEWIATVACRKHGIIGCQICKEEWENYQRELERQQSERENKNASR